MVTRVTTWIRILCWSVPNGERVNLAAVVYDDGGQREWRMLNDWGRAAVFADWPQEDMRQAVQGMIDEMNEWSLLRLHSQWRHEMSVLQLTPASPHFGRKPITDIADGVASSFLDWPEPPLSPG